MSKNLPEKAHSTTLGKGDLTRFARLEGQIEKALKVAAEPIGAALRTIRDEKLYLATHSSFERYVVERWGFSKATAYRMMDGEKLVGISPPETASSQVSTSHGETNRGEPSTNGSPLPAESSEEVAQTGETPAEPTRGTPSGKSSAEGGSGPASDAPSAGPSSGGAELQPDPPEPTDETAPKRSSSRSAPPGQSSGGGDEPSGQDSPPPGAISDADGLRWLNSKTAQEWRALGDPFGPGIRHGIKVAATAIGFIPAPAEKPQRRAVGKMGLSGNLKVGTDPYPRPEQLNGTAGRPTARITPNAARIGGGKRHAPDCSCYSCKAPKAAKG